MSESTRYVIDCWDIQTPAEFWELYLREVSPEEPERFGRNEDAFRNALTGGGPGRPGGSAGALEIIHIDKLFANGHADFVAFLEELSRELADAPHVELKVFRPSRLRHTLPRTIKLMADYQCWPIWEVQLDIGNIDPSTLPISKATRAALDRWAAAYDDTFDPDYPPDSAFPDKESEAAFEEEGRRLWSELQRELGETVRVLYYSEGERRVLEPETHEA